MTPGEHLIILGREEDAIAARFSGLQLRDTLLILLPGRQSLFAYLFRGTLEGTVAENVLKHGVGCLWIDGCRIYTQDNTAKIQYPQNNGQSMRDGEWKGGPTGGHPAGRWPTNLLLVHGPGCVRLGSKRVQGTSPIQRKSEVVSDSGTHPGWRRPGGGINTKHSKGYAEEDGTETVPNWQCQPDCPVRLLDEQSGELSVCGGPKSTHGTGGLYQMGSAGAPGVIYRDFGGASRFFPQFINISEALDWLAKLIGVRPC